MLRAIFRILSLVCLAVALVAGVLDITRSIADSQIRMMPLHLDWVRFSPDSLEGLHGLVTAYLGEFFWNPIFLTLLKTPTWIVFFLLSLLFALAARRRRHRWQENFGA
jgi:MYXO-CTERM domain-containing protein